MRHESTVTSISWIPSEAMSGPMRIPMDIGIGHYDPPPPDHLESGTIDELLATDRLRFANRLSAWVEVADGAIVDAGYSGGAFVGSTTADLGIGSLRFPGVAYPVIQQPPLIENGTARFVQTAGGRTGAPLPRRIDRPPYLRITAPTAWTTLALTIAADGAASFEVAGASPFPRHWIYDASGALAAKSGVVDFAEWTRVHDHERSPWHGLDREALVTEVESDMERRLSHAVMAAKPKLRKLGAGEELVRQGEPGDELFLVLDGMLDVVVDGEQVAEVGPGAIVGERALLEGGSRTSTLTARTPVLVAAVSGDTIDRNALSGIAEGHRREEV